MYWRAVSQKSILIARFSPYRALFFLANERRALPYANDFSLTGCAFALSIFYLYKNLTALPFRGFRGQSSQLGVTSRKWNLSSLDLWDYVPTDYSFYLDGGGFIAAGGGLLIGGYKLKSTAKTKIKEAVNVHNNSFTSSNVELNVGFTQNGIGLVLNF